MIPGTVRPVDERGSILPLVVVLIVVMSLSGIVLVQRSPLS